MTDSRELTPHVDGGSRELAPMPQSGGILAAVIEAARDPTVDADKVKSMVELGLKLQDRELRAQFNRDKIAAVRAMPSIYKRGQSDKHRYAKFEDLHRAVMPILAAHNLTLDFRVGSEGQNITVQPILRHDNGQIEEGGIMKGPPDQGPGRSAVQAVGSTTSYLKRHSMKAMLNIIEDDEDDDGRGGALATDQMSDRRTRLVEHAQEAKDDGKYDEWFGRQTPKDRAWLISTGRHALFGGAPLLPGAAQAGPEVAQERRSAPPPPPPPNGPPPADGGGELGLDGGGAKTKTQLTPRQWVDGFKNEVERCVTTDQLDLYLDGKRDKLARLEASDPALHKEAVKAHRDHREALAEAGK